jgi:hypothetical protein
VTRRSSLATVALAASALFGCAMTTIGVVQFGNGRESSSTMQLQAGADVRFWADFDGMYDWRDSAQYDVQLIQDGQVVATTTCDPIVIHDSTRVCTRLGWFGGVYKSHCRMRCRARVPRTGLTVVRARLSTCCAPKFTRVYAADLTIQQ